MSNSELRDSYLSENLQVSTTFIIDLEKRPFPFYRLPKEIGSFSCDGNRCYHDDKSKLQELNAPRRWEEISFHLSEGYDRFIRRDEEEKEYIDYILMWISQHTDAFSLGKDEPMLSLNTDFVCWRGLLTKLLCLPYENTDGLIIAVQRIRGSYYLCEFETELKERQRRECTDRQKLMCYWGYRFEHYMTKPVGDVRNAGDKVVVNNSEAYCGVYRGRLNDHSILFAGEIDCIDTNNVLNLKSNGKDETVKPAYVELKTSRIVENVRQERNLKRYKMIKWWAQCYLPNIPHILCGYRDDEGCVTNLTHYSTSNIPTLCQDTVGSSCWKPTGCFNFLYIFLSHLKKMITTDSTGKIYLFTYDPRSREIEGRAVGCGDGQWSFLPDWYITLMSSSTDLRQIPPHLSLHSHQGKPGGARYIN